MKENSKAEVGVTVFLLIWVFTVAGAVITGAVDFSAEVAMTLIWNLLPAALAFCLRKPRLERFRVTMNIGVLISGILSIRHLVFSYLLSADAQAALTLIFLPFWAIGILLSAAVIGLIIEFAFKQQPI